MGLYIVDKYGIPAADAFFKERRDGGSVEEAFDALRRFAVFSEADFNLTDQPSEQQSS